MKLEFISGLIGIALSTSLYANPFIGAGIGNSEYDFDNSEEPNSFEIYGGAKIDKHFAIEGGYIDFGEAEHKDFSSISVDASSFGGALRAIFPVADTVELYARIGIHAWDAESEVLGRSDDNDGTDLFYGIGGNLYLVDNLGLGLRYTKYDLDDLEVEVIGLNLEFYLQ